MQDGRLILPIWRLVVLCVRYCLSVLLDCLLLLNLIASLWQSNQSHSAGVGSLHSFISTSLLLCHQPTRTCGLVHATRNGILPC